MIKRFIAILLAWSCGVVALHATNSVIVRGAESDVGQQIEISVDFTTDSNDVAAAEIRIPIPEGVTPVEESCVKAANRLPSHSVTGDLNGNEYVIVIFNSNLTTIPAGTGKALSFKINLGENPGIFNLTPRVKLSDTSGRVIQATAFGETLKILGAKLELGVTDINFGRVPIRGTYTKTVRATNVGTSTLNFKEFTTDVPGLKVTSGSHSLEPNGSTTLTLDYQPIHRAASIAGRFTAESNAVGRSPFVRITSVPFSVNELHVGSAEGITDSEVTVSVTMNNMEPIVGGEVSFNLPEGLEYVEESAAPASRASAFVASANYDANRTLRLVLFNMDNQPVSGEAGEILTFKLRLKGRSGSYYLTPQKVILSNSASENMISATSAGFVTIQSPLMLASSTMDIGNVPLSGDNTFDYPVYNGSSVPLTIEKVVFLDDVAECKGDFPIIIDSYSNGKIPVTISNPKFGEFASTMNVYSNDPDNRLKTVAIKGNFYSANELTVEQTVEDGKCVLTAGLTNEANIVALQLDIKMPERAQVLSESDIKLLERAQLHSATLASIGQNKYRIIIFSLSNKAFLGNSGGIFSIAFDSSNIEGKQIIVENVKLSSEKGVNYTTPGREIIVNIVPVAVRNITLSSSDVKLKVGESKTLTASVFPQNAANNDIIWTSEDYSTASVDNKGVVSAIAIGETQIAAMSGGITAECKVTVIPVLAESLRITPEAWNGEEGGEFRIEATVLPENTTDKTVMFGSDDLQIATVNETGCVQVLREGTCKILVSTTDGSNLVAECLITSISGVEYLLAGYNGDIDVYNQLGVLLKRKCCLEDLRQLQPGIYIIRYGTSVRTVCLTNRR